MAGFSRVDKTTVSDTVIDQIMELIGTGQLKPGERLPSEHGLVELLGVGRSSIREALKALEALGLIQRRNEGSFIKDDFSGPALSKMLYLDLVARELEIIHVYQARQLLETHLGAVAAVNMTDAALAELDRLCIAMELTPDDQVEAHVKLDKEFHHKLSDLADNPVLIRLWELAFEVLFEIRRRVPFTSWEIRHSDTRHRLLMDALHARDPELVKKTMSETLELGERMLMKALAERAATPKPA